MLKNNGIKLLVLDLETTNLDANRGHILCAVAKWVNDKKIFKWRIDENPSYGSSPRSWADDSRIVKELKGLITEADAVIAYYGGYGRFDIPFINTRLITHRLEPLPPITVIDPHKAAKSRLKLSRNGLAQVTELFRTTIRKGHVPLEVWMLAAYGDTRAIGTLLRYCVDDVLALEELYLRIRPLISDHPHVARPTSGNDPRKQCPNCGSYNTQSRGHRFTKAYQIFRLFCKNCKSYPESHRTKLPTKKYEI